jgi:hypothetical protein
MGRKWDQGGAGGKKLSIDEARAKLGQRDLCYRKVLPEVGVNVNGCLGGETHVGAEQGYIGVLTWSNVEWKPWRTWVRLT